MSHLIENLSSRAAETPDKIIVRGASATLTALGLIQEVERTSGWLQATIPNHDRRPVAIALDNGPAWVVLDLALIQLGWPSLPLPPFFTPEQTGHALKDAGAMAVIQRAAGEADAFDIAGTTIAIKSLNLPPKGLPQGTAKITYTSGSTGTPKGVCLSLAQMESLCLSLIDTLGADYAGVHLAILPLGVLLENVAGLYTTLLAGGTYHVMGLAELGLADPRAPDARAFITAIAHTQASSLILVPELLQLLIAALAAIELRLPHLRFVAVGGAKVSHTLLAKASSLGLPVFEGYGLSECASVVALNTPAAARAGRVGRPLPHLQVRIADDGEIMVRNRTETTTFMGYVGGSEPDRELATGDLGELDDDGFLTITGRKKNILILASGRNVSPEWIEAELLANPDIAQVLIHGDGQSRLSALIVPRLMKCSSEVIEVAIARVNQQLPTYAQIADWRIVQAFAAARGHLTANGRLRRDAILSDYLNLAPQDIV